MGNKISLEDEMINLKLAAKQMNRSSRKCEKNEKAAIEKLKKVGIQALFFKHDLISYLRSFFDYLYDWPISSYSIAF